MVAAAGHAGYDLTGHCGVQISSALLDWADLVLAMDGAVLDALRELADENTAPKLALYLGDGDVPDPWQQPDEAFAACVKVVEAGVSDAGPSAELIWRRGCSRWSRRPQ